MAIEWTEAHRREALRRTYELAARATSETNRAVEDQARVPVLANGYSDVRTEFNWRMWLSNATRLRDGTHTVDIDREVRRVDALAKGRLVRERGYRVKSASGHVSVFFTGRARGKAKTHRDSIGNGARLVRVTRIRRVW